MSAVDFFLKLLTSRLGQFSRYLASVNAVFFFCWLKSYNSTVFPCKSIHFSANFQSTQLPWVLGIFGQKLLIRSANSHGTLLPWVPWFFFADNSLINMPYFRKKIYFSQIVFTAHSCREGCNFFVENYWPVGYANSHDTLLPWVPWFFLMTKVL